MPEVYLSLTKNQKQEITARIKIMASSDLVKEYEKQL